MSATPGLFGSLVQVVSEIRGSRKAHLRSLAALADKKFKQLDEAHTLFLRLLGELHAQVRSVKSISTHKHSPQALANQILEKSVAIMDARSKGREQRRADYEEASVYAEKALVDRTIFKKTPDEIRDRLQALMSSYCGYFSIERQYRHELERVLQEVNKTMELYSNLAADAQANMDRSATFQSDLDRILSRIDHATLLSRERWAIVARDYHLLAYNLRQSGINF